MPVVFKIGNPVVTLDVNVRAFQVFPVLLSHYDERGVTIIFRMFAHSPPGLQGFFRGRADEINENQVGRNLPAAYPFQRILFAQRDYHPIAVSL
ncbi:MAG TPA: hypothetical protein VEV81_07330 [Pyrinomonadaceae bacterium]|nr:hypothetical protein [Pyrinomonadaceae bacterium]